MRLLHTAYLFFFPFALLWAQEYSIFAEQAYKATLRLDEKAFKASMDSLLLSEPNNAVRYHLNNYRDFFRLFIHEEADYYEQVYPLKHERIQKIQSEGDPSSPYYLYIQADIHLQWALVEAKFRDFFSAFRDVRKAYRLLEENSAKFPDFAPNQKNIGMLVALVGTLPEEFRWGFEWISGIPGDLDEGQKRMELALNSNAPSAALFKDEIRVLYSILLLHVLKEEEQAWNILQALTIEAEESDLVTFIMANTAMRRKEMAVADTYLSEALKRDAVQIPHLYYLKGLSEMYRGNLESSRNHLYQFLQEFDGLHYRKSAWLYLSYTFYLEGDMASYDAARLKCLAEGDNLIDEDKFAEAQSEKRGLPDQQLLEIRLAFDGGNYNRAQELISKAHEQLEGDAQQKFLVYYQARIYQESGAWDQAIDTFRKVYAMPNPTEGYFAINAALQIGEMLIASGQCREAVEWLNKCLKTSSEAYQRSIHQKAKAAKMRCL